MSNADAIAFAIVGAARGYGDDPIAALVTLDRGKHSPARSVTAAINALATEPGDLAALSRVLRRDTKSVWAARKYCSTVFQAASASARALVKLAAAEALADEGDVLDELPDAEIEPPEDVAADVVPADLLEEPAALLDTGSEVDPELTPAEPEPEDRSRVVQAFAAGAAEKRGAAPEPFVPKGSGTTSALVRQPPQAPSAALFPAESLRARIIAALKKGPLGVQALATLVDAKELVVGQTLSQLHKEGVVGADDRYGVSSRAVRWSLAPEWVAA
jgi:hypothetical protein